MYTFCHFPTVFYYPMSTVPSKSVIDCRATYEQAIDFDNGDLISYRIVSGNADGCFALDAAKGVLSTVCDLRTLPMRTR